jgi:hypothetical protein
VNTETRSPLTPAAAVREGSRTPRAVAGHLRGRVRATGAARLSMGGASGSAQLKLLTAVRTSSALVVARGWRRAGGKSASSPRSPESRVGICAASARLARRMDSAVALASKCVLHDALAACRRLVWRRLAAWACSSPPSSAGVAELVTLAGRGVDRCAVDALVSDAQARARGRRCSASALSGAGEPQRAVSGLPLSGPLRPHTAPLTLPLPASGAGILPSPWGAT